MPHNRLTFNIYISTIKVRKYYATIYFVVVQWSTECWNAFGWGSQYIVRRNSNDFSLAVVIIIFEIERAANQSMPIAIGRHIKSCAMTTTRPHSRLQPLPCNHSSIMSTNIMLLSRRAAEHTATNSTHKNQLFMLRTRRSQSHWIFHIRHRHDNGLSNPLVLNVSVFGVSIAHCLLCSAEDVL